MKKRNIIIIVILVVVAIGSLVAYKMIDEKTPDLGDKKPDVIITATDLIAAFDMDTTSAIKLYVDKLIEVSGNVKSIDTAGSIVLGEEGSASAVTVSLDRRHIKDHEKLIVGSITSIIGKCVGYNNGNGEDLIESLGTTVELNFASVKKKK